MNYGRFACMLLVMLIFLHGIGRYTQTHTNKKIQASIAEMQETQIEILQASMGTKDELRTMTEFVSMVNHWVSPKHVKDSDGKCNQYFCPLNDKTNIGQTVKEVRMKNRTFIDTKDEISNEAAYQKLKAERIKVENAVHQ